MPDGCKSCKWTGKVPFLWHGVTRSDEAPDSHRMRSCVAACRCDLGSKFGRAAGSERKDADSMVRWLSEGAGMGLVLEWWAGYDTPPRTERDIGVRVRQCNAEARKST